MAKMAGPHASLDLQTMTTSEIATVLAWHDALNSSDLDTLVGLSSDDIDVSDAQGAAQGHDALRSRSRACEGGAAIRVHLAS